MSGLHQLMCAHLASLLSVHVAWLLCFTVHVYRLTRSDFASHCLRLYVNDIATDAERAHANATAALQRSHAAAVQRLTAELAAAEQVRTWSSSSSSSSLVYVIVCDYEGVHWSVSFFLLPHTMRVFL